MANQVDDDVKPADSATVNLLAAARSAAKKGPAPVHLWNPPFCGDLDMEIRRDGTWFYQGIPIGRAAMVRLFASILKREGDDYFLVTPVEKVRIRVQDAPFIAIDAEIGSDITFETNVGDQAVAGPDNPIRVMHSEGAPRPYVHVRRDLWALIDRKTFYRLADAARPGPDGRMGVTSGGQFFALEP